MLLEMNRVRTGHYGLASPYSLDVLQLSLDVSLESCVYVAVYLRVFVS